MKVRTMRSKTSIFCLVLLGTRTAVCLVELQCLVSPVGALHPVQGLLEHFRAGPGCAARESGLKETHVISVEGVTVSQPNQVTVLLRPLFFSRPLGRPVTLVLSSQNAVSWWLEGDRLPPDLVLTVQVSASSTVQSRGLEVHTQQVPSLPWRPRALLRWALKRHSSLSSLSRAAHANRVYLRLGEDPTMPSACQLQSLFLSHNYLTSELQPQVVRGCSPSGGIAADFEVHVIQLQSAGSGMCGSLQVEVPVSVLPPVANAGWHELVLILSSAVPVNWALTATGLQGHIAVYSSSTVSPLYPSEPGLTMTNMLTPNLYGTHDLLAWAKQHGFPTVTSYTEAELANRFVIQLTGTRRGHPSNLRSLAVWLEGAPAWSRQDGLRQLLNQQRGLELAGGAVDAPINVECHDGLLSVAINLSALEPLPFTVSVVTLRDARCQAQFNGSHFLLVFPVIFCGTEGVMETEPRGVQYRNTVLLWRDSPSDATHNQTGEDSPPHVMHVTCWIPVPSPPPAAGPQGDSPSPSSLRTEQRVKPRGAPQPPGGPPMMPVLSVRLSVTEAFEQRAMGPCVVTADSRVYVEVSVRGSVRGGLEVRSCVVSPLSDPQASPGWAVIKDGCSLEPTLTLAPAHTDREGDGQRRGRGLRQESEGDATGSGARHREKEGHTEEREGWRRTGAGGAGESAEKEGRAQRHEEAAAPSGLLRFSFVLRPVYNNSVQFLHCQLQQCEGEPAPAPTGPTPPISCRQGLQMPALITQPNHIKCHYRTLSRPMLVTQPIAVPRPFPPSGVRTALKPRLASQSKHSSAANGTGVDTGPLVGIVFAAFLMGVSLVGALWCIYSHTGVTQALRRGNLLETTNQSTSWTPPAILEQSNSSV